MDTRAAPSVSVVLPVHNAEKHIERAVASILQQTLADLEIITVDDGSTDSTPERLKRCAATDRRLRVVRTEHRGIVSALNHGLAAARAPLIARMDADDLSCPDRLAVQKRYMDEHVETGVLSCAVEFGGDPHAARGFAEYLKWVNSLTSDEAIRRNRFVESPVVHPSVMFRSELVERHGGYCEGEFPEDYELWLRWIGKGVRFAKVPETLLVWQDLPRRLTRRDPRYSRRAFYRCKARYLARWLARNNPRYPDIIVWGAGRETRKRAEFLTAHGIRIKAYVDIDPRKIGQVIHERPVLSEEQIPPPEECFVVPFVGSRGARDDIRRRLAARAFREERDFIVAA